MSSVPVGLDTVVSVKIELYDAQGVLLHAPEQPMAYLHGGYGNLFGPLERALEGKHAGDAVWVQLEPEDAFGEYDAELVRVESVERYGKGLEVGMEVEEALADGEARLYRVTDLAEGKAVLDANHPLAGMALRFHCTVVAARQASADEVRRGAPDSPIIAS